MVCIGVRLWSELDSGPGSEHGFDCDWKSLNVLSYLHLKPTNQVRKIKLLVELPYNRLILAHVA